MKDNIIIDNLIKLKLENPTLRICVMVDQDLFLGEEYGWSEGHISKAEIGDYYRDEERLFSDEDDLIEHIECYYNASPDDEETKEEFNKIFKRIYHEKVIYLKITT